jgi:hypothetical protein
MWQGIALSDGQCGMDRADPSPGECEELGTEGARPLAGRSGDTSFGRPFGLAPVIIRHVLAPRLRFILPQPGVSVPHPSEKRLGIPPIQVERKVL